MNETATRQIFVQPLNDALQGPFTPEGAVSAIRNSIYASPETLAAIARDHAAGGTGPWHFSYGFHSVTAWTVTGYLGSDQELLDIARGIKAGGRCLWLVDPEEMEARITSVVIDEDGDAFFDLTFDGDHKDVRADRDEIAPLPARPG